MKKRRIKIKNILRNMQVRLCKQLGYDIVKKRPRVMSYKKIVNPDDSLKFYIKSLFLRNQLNELGVYTVADLVNQEQYFLHKNGISYSHIKCLRKFIRLNGYKNGLPFENTDGNNKKERLQNLAGNIHKAHLKTIVRVLALDLENAMPEGAIYLTKVLINEYAFDVVPYSNIKTFDTQDHLIREYIQIYVNDMLDKLNGFRGIDIKNECLTTKVFSNEQNWAIKPCLLDIKEVSKDGNIATIKLVFNDWNVVKIYE